jgi:hypothetical protein
MKVVEGEVPLRYETICAFLPSFLLFRHSPPSIIQFPPFLLPSPSSLLTFFSGDPFVYSIPSSSPSSPSFFLATGTRHAHDKEDILLMVLLIFYAVHYRTCILQTIGSFGMGMWILLVSFYRGAPSNNPGGKEKRKAI